MNKIIYILISLLLVSFWGCHPTWWEVQPQEIYSPADFHKDPKVTIDNNNMIIEFSVNLRSKPEDTDTLGVYLYDNLFSLASELTKTGDQVSGNDNSKVTSQINKWKKVKVENGIGKVTINSIDTSATYYLLPILRNYKNGKYNNFFSNSYLKIQLSPWSKLSNVNTNTNVRFFTDSLSLFYVYNDASSITFFKLDPTTNRFNQAGVNSDVNISKFQGSINATILDVLHVSYNKKKNQYYLIIDFYQGNSVYKVGKLILDNDFNIIEYQDFPALSKLVDHEATDDFKRIYERNDTLYYLCNRPFFGSSKYYRESISGAVSLESGQNLFSYKVDSSFTNPPLTGAFIGSGILLKYNNLLNFIYSVNKLTYTVDFPKGIDMTSNPFIVENGNGAYMSAGKGDSNLYYVRVGNNNNIIFDTTELSQSRPSANSSSQSYSQGLFYKGYLTLLYQKSPTIGLQSIPTPSEVWQINPSRLTIDKRHPYKEIVPISQ